MLRWTSHRGDCGKGYSTLFALSTARSFSLVVVVVVVMVVQFSLA